MLSTRTTGVPKLHVTTVIVIDFGPEPTVQSRIDIWAGFSAEASTHPSILTFGPGRTLLRATQRCPPRRPDPAPSYTEMPSVREGRQRGEGGEAAEGPFPSNAVLRGKLVFLRVYKVSGPTVFGFGRRFLARPEILVLPTFLKGFVVQLFWPGELYIPSES